MDREEANFALLKKYGYDILTNIKGKVNPKNSNVFVNNEKVNVDKKGYFEGESYIKNENNIINVKAHNPKGGKTEIIKLSIQRIFTEEELAEKEKIKKENKEKLAKEKAKREAEERQKEQKWLNSKAGQICTQHPEWIKEECIKLADRKYWIGMTYDMLVYLRGKPNVANPSNYGYGVNWQWCWTYYTPSCFYGDSFGYVESYN